MIGLFLTPFAGAYLPHKDKSTEFRVVANTGSWSQWEWHGQIVGGSVLHPKLKVAGLLEMSTDKSAMRGLVEYELNEYLKLGISAGVDQEAEGLGDFVITGDIPLADLDFLPFLKISHKALGEAGLVLYWTIGKVVFNAGVSYMPEIKDHQKQRFQFMLGTGFK